MSPEKPPEAPGAAPGPSPRATTAKGIVTPEDQAAKRERRDTTITLFGDHRELLEAWALTDRCSLSQAVRKLIEHARASGFAPAQVKIDERNTEEKFLDKLVEVGDEALAAHRVGMHRLELERRLLEDQAFIDSVDWSKRLYVAELQELLVCIGAGRQKGDGKAIKSLLDAFHTDFGKPNEDSFRRQLLVMQGQLVKIFQEKFGPAHKKAIDEALEEFAVWVEPRLAAMS